MNEMSSNRNYNDRDYDNRYDYRDYDNRYDYRDNYREDYRYDNRGDYRENYRDDYREDYRRDYDRRGGKINNRNYRNYREEDYYEELEMICYDMKDMHRKIEDVAEMAENTQDKNMLMKLTQKEKENYNYIKQMMEK